MALVLMLMMVTSSLSTECPPNCHCSPKIFDCRNTGLKEVPKGIPLTVTGIYLSDNPLLPIQRSYFLKFSKLETLLLRSTGQTGPVYLPKSLVHFDFSSNLINVDCLKTMFKIQLDSLKKLKMEGNNLDITKVFPILPKGIEYLHLSGNKLLSLKRNDLNCCMNLKEFHCRSCSLQFIEPNAFADVREIATIVLSNNELTDLPDGIFEGLSKLKRLEIRCNRLEFFNASKVKLKCLNSLQLGYNRIQAIDLQLVEITDIGLESNRIRRLDENSFGSSNLIHELSFQRNQIKEISQGSFDNVKFISALILQGNDIEELPRNFLSTTFVSMLFLHNNSLSNVDFIQGMTRLPSLLTLFANKKLSDLNTSIFKSINQHSNIYMSCYTLTIIQFSSKKRVSINCCPSSDLVIRTPFRFLSYDGYECKWEGTHSYYKCRACPIGFYDGSDAKHEVSLGCAPCPSGSFYQDELASLHCKNCPVGQYVPPSRSPGKDASDCQTCPQGTNTAKPAGTRACSCLPGYHRRSRFGACEQCLHDGFKCVRDYPQLKEGFWMTWNGTGSCKREFKSYMYNLETFNNDYDRNTMNFTCQLPVPIKCPKPGSCHGGIDSNCSSGYTGVLCGVCSKGYLSHFTRCVKCPKIYLVILKWIGLMVIFIILCFAVSEKSDNDYVGSKRTQRFDDDENRTMVEIFTSSFKILIGFYQTLIRVITAYRGINWPENMIAITSIMKYVEFEIISIPSLRCINPKWAIDAVEEFWLSLSVFLGFPIICLMYFLAKSCHLHCKETYSMNVRRRISLCAINCTRIAALFMFISYPIISTRIMHVLPSSCRVICTAYRNSSCLHYISFLRSDYSLTCPTLSTHRYTLIAVYCSLIIPVGLPFLLWIVLRQSFRKHGRSLPRGSTWQYVSTSGQDEVDSSDHEAIQEHNFLNITISDDLSAAIPPVFKSSLRFTYENYKGEFWYWEVIEMARKLMMTTASALFLYNTKMGLSILIIISIAFAILHAMRQPMKDGFENFLQMLSLWIVPINLSAGAVIQSSIAGQKASNGNDSESWKVGIFLIVMNSLLITLIVGRLAKLAAERTITRIF